MNTKTVKEYLDDPANAQKMLMKLGRITWEDILRDVGDSKREALGSLVDCPITIEGLNDDNKDRMNYFDILCLIANIRDNEEYRSIFAGENEASSPIRKWQDEYMYQIYLLIYVLLNMKKRNTTVNFLLEAPLKNICKVMEERVHTGKVMAKYRSLVMEFRYARWSAGRTFRNGTIQDILDSATDILDRRYIPGILSPEAYVNRIKETLFFVSYVLIDLFELAYPERFHIEDVRDKYQ